MRRSFKIERKLEKILSKVYKKDRNKYDEVMKKIEEIVHCKEVNHYKNLRRPLQDKKRVHIDSHFVLTFKYVPEEKLVIFYDLDHHDKIYRR